LADIYLTTQGATVIYAEPERRFRVRLAGS
jgi:hypothetical protein